MKGENFMNYTPLDLIAVGTKLAVENSSLPRSQKEYAKLGIDCTTELIKQFTMSPQVSFSVMGFSPDQLHALKAAAAEHRLNRVILFPCSVNGVLVPCLNMESGDIPAFCNAIGLKSPANINITASENVQKELMRQYGVVIYLREP